MEIVNVDQDNFESVIEFLNKVQTIKNLDFEVVKNASVIIHKGEIDGVLSYERFNNYGLIRYFVFKKNTEDLIIYKLFHHILDKVKQEKIDYLITLIVKEEITDLFYHLGFSDMEKKYFFIEENNILYTNFKDTYVLKLNIH